MARAKIGIIGGGNISETYLRYGKLFSNLEIVAIADIVPAVAKARAEQFAIRAMTVDGLLGDKGIDAVINLTVPNAHFQVSHEILSAGKHAYSEKPLSLTAGRCQSPRQGSGQARAEARRRARHLPRRRRADGARLLDKGTIGTVVAATAHVMSHGMENWHPNPAFFFKPGGGPVFDIGPYYITTLVSLLGPVRRVAAMAKKGFDERIVTSGPRQRRAHQGDDADHDQRSSRVRPGGAGHARHELGRLASGHANPIELYGRRLDAGPDPNSSAASSPTATRAASTASRHSSATVRRAQLAGAAGPPAAPTTACSASPT